MGASLDDVCGRHLLPFLAWRRVLGAPSHGALIAAAMVEALADELEHTLFGGRFLFCDRMIMIVLSPNKALQRTQPSRPGYNPRVPCSGLLSLVRSAHTERFTP